jgi:hypothetical protein
LRTAHERNAGAKEAEACFETTPKAEWTVAYLVLNLTAKSETLDILLRTGKDVDMLMVKLKERKNLD